MADKRGIIFGICITAIIVGSVAGGIYFLRTPPTPFITIQTTTSLQDSGLLDMLIPAFFAATGINASYVAVGSGQAMTNAGNGDGDLCLVHSPAAELNFTNHSTAPSGAPSYWGKGIMHMNWAYNYFMVVGPASNPANILPSDNGTVAFEKIYQGAVIGLNCTFASRGDGSGTQSKENSTWNAAGKLIGGLGSTYIPNPATATWYKSLGEGMLSTLQYTAQQSNCYTLTDLATWMKNWGPLNSTAASLTVLSNKTASDLKNIYSIILVDPTQFSQGTIKFDLAKQFFYWLIEDGLNIIGNYSIDGVSLFNLSVLGLGTGAANDEISNGTAAAKLGSQLPGFAPAPSAASAMTASSSLQESQIMVCSANPVTVKKVE